MVGPGSERSWVEHGWPIEFLVMGAILATCVATWLLVELSWQFVEDASALLSVLYSQLLQVWLHGLLEALVLQGFCNTFLWR